MTRLKPVDRLELVSVDQVPILGPETPGSEVARFGFEGGTSVKEGDRYYVFTTEVFDVPKTAATRLALWASDDGRSFNRITTLAETNFDWNDSTHRMSPWSPMAVYDPSGDRWNVFHVGYRRKPGSDQFFNMSGRIARLVSQSPGRKGIVGPYVEAGWVALQGVQDGWEGSAGEVSFFPYLHGDSWSAFYGCNEVPVHLDDRTLAFEQASTGVRFRVGLSSAPTIVGPWTRENALNPVLLDPDFVENPVVTRVREDLFIVLYDGANVREISYATSSDGLHWGSEMVLALNDVAPAQIKITRTPLGLIDEGDGLFSIYFTAFDGVNPEQIEPLWHEGFGGLWRCNVRLNE